MFPSVYPPVRAGFWQLFGAGERRSKLYRDQVQSRAIRLAAHLRRLGALHRHIVDDAETPDGDQQQQPLEVTAAEQA